jgi:preprotein translocase subunit YajC
MGVIVVFIVLAAMWALLALPRQREARRHKAVMAALTVGDEVMTGTGLFGTIVEMSDDRVWLEIAPGTVIKMDKRAVGTKVEGDEALSSSATPTRADSSLSPVDRSED